MGRRRGPLDRGQWISTAELLAAVVTHGPQWPAAMSRYPIAAVSLAVAREITARNLYDAATLTDQGRATLLRLQTEQQQGTGSLEIQRADDCALHPEGCWRIDCVGCAGRVLEHVGDAHLEDGVVAAVATHCCEVAPVVPSPRAPKVSELGGAPA